MTEKQLMEVVADRIGSDFVDLFEYDIDPKLLDRFPLAMLEKIEAIPYLSDEESIHVATDDPERFELMETIERVYPDRQIVLHTALKKDILRILRHIGMMQDVKQLIREVKHESAEEKSKKTNNESAIMRLIRLIIKHAVGRNASDLHIEPNNSACSVRVRVDGVLHEIFVFDLTIFNALSTRIKILGNLDISEKRRPQDGRFELSVDGNAYDFRLSTVPTLHGESLVMRILDQQKVLLRLNELGFTEENLKRIEHAAKQPYGVVLVTGPTGSGKTTTLYAMLNEIKNVENKVMTIEDPIEYQLSRIQQLQVNEKVDLGFAEALRSFFRQDPDIIMVGEIRDLETLSAVTQASLTGHLVLSTLHTNDAPGAVNRMLSMGLESYLLADALLAIVSQRLVRKVCTYCRTEVKPNKEQIQTLEKWLPEHYKLYKGTGCSHCEMTGYLGRTIISEVIEVNEDISEMITRKETKQAIAKRAEELNLYHPMVVEGIEKAISGITSIDEILRVTRN